MPPTEFRWLSRKQYAQYRDIVPLTNTSTIDWCMAESLPSAEPILVPAAAVYASLLGRDGNFFLPELTTTGVACHSTVEGATWLAMCEVIEREALAIAWHAGGVFAPVNPCGTAAEELTSGSRAGNSVQMVLFRVPTGAPFPVLLAVAWGQSSFPWAATGVACRRSAVDAAIKAACEAAQMRALLEHGTRHPPRSVRTFADHGFYYAAPDGARELWRRLNTDKGPVWLEDIESAGAGPPDVLLTKAVQYFTGRGLTLARYVYPPLTREPLPYVVRIVAPQVMDVNADERFPRLGLSSLYTTPVRLGWCDRSPTEDDISLSVVPLA